MVLRGNVTLLNVRLLGVGKVSMLPNKGKSKGKGKAKGKGAPKGGSDKGGNAPSSPEPCVPVYLGNDGYVVCAMASGHVQVQNVPQGGG